jgi:hypothetical protein
MSEHHRAEITRSKSLSDSPASKVMDEAIELAIAEESPYPEKAMFVNADTPHTDREINYAAQQGHSVVLVSPAGDIQIIAPEELAGGRAAANLSPARLPEH